MLFYPMEIVINALLIVIDALLLDQQHVIKVIANKALDSGTIYVSLVLAVAPNVIHKTFLNALLVRKEHTLKAILVFPV